MKLKIGFIGLGLIGGSIAKAVRQYYPECEIIAFDKSKESLALAMQESVIDTVCSSVDENFSLCDYIFLCTPVSSNNAYLAQLKPYIHEKCIITDVGSVKAPIHKEIEALGMEENFIGGHPMAGSEKTGYANSKAMLIENAYYILTPSANVSSDKITKMSELIDSLKAIPIILDYEKHDYITGTISHLPHLLAAGLVNYVKENDSEDELMKLLAAGGFKDMTRIASSSPVMWQQICLENSGNITEILGKYIVLLEQVKEFVENKNSQALYDMFASSKDYRNAIPDASAGPIKKAFALYCDIADVAGGIAAVAVILANCGINIKNIGIIHNREFEEGVLRVEFYEEESLSKAAKLLQEHKYAVYER
ncbi:MAG: prephenate dehydrogenase [Methanosarcinales archaeon]|jgi:prephenate dehydrogenase|nr:prephenate dehydrogenase [Methanosarcinales archaeon]